MSGELVFLVSPMFFFYISCKSILVHVHVVQGRIQEFLIGGGGGGGLQTLLNSERTVETFLWQIVCNRDDQVLRRLLLAQEILLCKQRRTDHRRVPKKQLHFWISLEFILVAKCNVRFIEKNHIVKKVIYEPVDVRVSVSNKHQAW